MREVGERRQQLELEHEEALTSLKFKQDEVRRLQQAQVEAKKEHEGMVQLLEVKVRELEEKCRSQSEQFSLLSQELERFRLQAGKINFLTSSIATSEQSSSPCFSQIHFQSGVEPHEKKDGETPDVPDAAPGEKAEDQGTVPQEVDQPASQKEDAPVSSKKGLSKPALQHETAKSESTHSSPKSCLTQEVDTASEVEELDIDSVSPVPEPENRGPAKLQVFIARYSYNPFDGPNENPEAELPLTAGEYIYVYGEMDEDGFYEGELMDGRRGLVPSNFVERISDEDMLTFHPPEANDLSHSSFQEISFHSGSERNLPLSANSTEKSDVSIPEEEDPILGKAEDLLTNGFDTDVEELGDDAVPYPRKLTLIKQLAKSIIVSWEPPLVPAGWGDVWSYNIFVDKELRLNVKFGLQTKAVIERLDLNLKAYRISVQSVTEKGNSDELRCSILVGRDVCVAPTRLRLQNVTATSTELSWLPSNSNYAHAVHLNEEEYEVVKMGNYSYSFRNLRPNVRYRVKVEARPHRTPWELPLERRERKCAITHFTTLTAGPPDAPLDVQVEAGLSPGIILITWLPVTIDAAGTSNGVRVTGYAVYADGNKVIEVSSPTAGSILVGPSQIEVLQASKELTVRTMSPYGESADSVPVKLPSTLFKLSLCSPSLQSPPNASFTSIHNSSTHVEVMDSISAKSPQSLLTSSAFPQPLQNLANSSCHPKLVVHATCVLEESVDSLAVRLPKTMLEPSLYSSPLQSVANSSLSYEPSRSNIPKQELNEISQGLRSQFPVSNNNLCKERRTPALSLRTPDSISDGTSNTRTDLLEGPMPVHRDDEGSEKMDEVAVVHREGATMDKMLKITKDSESAPGQQPKEVAVCSGERITKKFSEKLPRDLTAAEETDVRNTTENSFSPELDTSTGNFTLDLEQEMEEKIPTGNVRMISIDDFLGGEPQRPGVTSTSQKGEEKMEQQEDVPELENEQMNTYCAESSRGSDLSDILEEDEEEELCSDTPGNEDLERPEYGANNESAGKHESCETDSDEEILEKILALPLQKHCSKKLFSIPEVTEEEEEEEEEEEVQEQDDEDDKENSNKEKDQAQAEGPDNTANETLTNTDHSVSNLTIGAYNQDLEDKGSCILQTNGKHQDLENILPPDSKSCKRGEQDSNLSHNSAKYSGVCNQLQSKAKLYSGSSHKAHNYTEVNSNSKMSQYSEDSDSFLSSDQDKREFQERSCSKKQMQELKTLSYLKDMYNMEVCDGFSEVSESNCKLSQGSQPKSPLKRWPPELRKSKTLVQSPKKTKSYMENDDIHSSMEIDIEYSTEEEERLPFAPLVVHLGQVHSGWCREKVIAEHEEMSDGSSQSNGRKRELKRQETVEDEVFDLGFIGSRSSPLSSRRKFSPAKGVNPLGRVKPSLERDLVGCSLEYKKSGRRVKTERIVNGQHDDDSYSMEVGTNGDLWSQHPGNMPTCGNLNEKTSFSPKASRKEMNQTKETLRSTSPEIKGNIEDNVVRIFVALFDYDPVIMSPNPDAAEEELPFREGQIIKVHGDKDADGFYRGESVGRTGYVPCNMVSEIQVEDEEIREQLLQHGYLPADTPLEKLGSNMLSQPPRRAVPPPKPRRSKKVESAVWENSYNPEWSRPSSGSQPVAPRTMVAVFDYDPKESSPNVDVEAELSFSAGDIITVFGDMDDDGFFYGELNGQQGLVPSNFLEVVPENGAETARRLTEDSDPHGANRERPVSLESPGKQSESNINSFEEATTLNSRAGFLGTHDTCPDSPGQTDPPASGKKKKGFFSKGKKLLKKLGSSKRD
nr:PREDICTED: peripheral-type benzodiazepine receptor-associated protein 1 [Latimeria chalumnae]|eukprot:XP_014341750.1 PREDICTED: peripheral-type benzodiazepine receptor-associated protein 1 [Latimeria chalumnae]